MATASPTTARTVRYRTFSYPGTITVVMSDGKGGDAYCTYQGSPTGAGQR